MHPCSVTTEMILNVNETGGYDHVILSQKHILVRLQNVAGESSNCLKITPLPKKKKKSRREIR